MVKATVYGITRMFRNAVEAQQWINHITRRVKR